LFGPQRDRLAKIWPFEPIWFAHDCTMGKNFDFLAKSITRLKMIFLLFLVKIEQF
jgi:hypothetical protein